MKKLLCVFLALLATVCLLSVAVSAKTSVILSDDLQTLTLDNRTYSRADLSAISLYYDDSYAIQLPQNLQSQLKNATVSATSNRWVISVELFYLDGSRLELCFVYDLVRPELLRLCQDEELVCGIEFWWEDTPSVTAPISQFKGTATTLTSSELEYAFCYDITYPYRELDTTVYRGLLCEYLGKYYYVDFRENNIPYPDSYFLYDEPEQFKAYEITDPELVGQIGDALKAQSGSDGIGAVLTAILLSFLFAVIPIAILILSVIFTIRGKGYYRVTWGLTAGLCIAELIVFITIVGNILLA